MATSVIFSLFFSILAILWLAFRRELFRFTILLPDFLLCTVLSYFLSFWTDDGIIIQLHIIQVLFMWLALRSYFKADVSPFVAFSMTFVSNLLVDILKAYLKFGSIDGVGEGGYYDAILIFPICSLGITYYVRWRRSHSRFANTLAVASSFPPQGDGRG